MTLYRIWAAKNHCFAFRSEIAFSPAVCFAGIYLEGQDLVMRIDLVTVKSKSIPSLCFVFLRISRKILHGLQKKRNEPPL